MERDDLLEVRKLLEEKERTLEILQHKSEGYKKNLEVLTKENDELRELKMNNGKDITEFKFKNEHMEKEIRDKVKTIQDKQQIIETQASHIKALEGDLITIKANFKKCEGKLLISSAEINKGNEYLDKLKNKKNEYKVKYKECSQGFKEVSSAYSEYKQNAEKELTDLRAKAKLCEEQKLTIVYLQKKLTDEQKLNSNFIPSVSEKPASSISQSRPSLPKSTSFQPTAYKSSFIPTERPSGNNGDRYSGLPKPQYSSTHQSPYSRYQENKNLNGTPSASSLHSINFSSASMQSSVNTSYQINCPSNNTPSYKREMNIEEEKFDKENNAPNIFKMSVVHTTKPENGVKSPSEFKKSIDFGPSSKRDSYDER
jgi:predicted  nucleic acid-binding Zn-ribbon protein